MKHQRIPSRCVGGAMLLASLLLSASAFGYEKEIDALSAAMAAKIAGKGKKTVAVVDFTDLQGNVTELGRFIAEELSGSLAGKEKGFEVVNRSNLKQLLQEHKLFATGAIDQQAAMKLGEIAGIQALVTGTITPFTESVRVSTSVLDINTAKVIDNEKENIPRTKDINELLDKPVAVAAVNEGRGAETKKADANKLAQAKKEKGNMTQEVKGFTFNVKECKKSGDFIACGVYVTSNNEDKEIKILANLGGYRTVIYDDAGNEYTASKLMIGDLEATGSISRRFVDGIKTITFFEFKGVNSETTTGPLFEIECLVKGEHFSVQFLNVPISK